jgi:hypothetical protein
MPVSTVHRWKKEGMPVQHQGRNVVAHPEELNQWLQRTSGELVGVHVATADSDLMKDLRASVAAQQGAINSSPKRGNVLAKRDVKGASKKKARSRLWSVKPEKEHSQRQAAECVKEGWDQYRWGVTPRRTFSKLKTKINVEKAVTRTVPMSASSASPLSVMVGVCTSGMVMGKPVLPRIKKLRRKMSVTGRRRIAAAQKARWGKIRAQK